MQQERRSIIVDTVPAFIDNLAEALAPNYPRKVATDGTSIASEHGGERARLTRVSPRELIEEYQILRDVLFQTLSEGRKFDESEAEIVLRSIDQALGESLTAYFLVHEGLREQFTVVLTHDIRNPLSVIKTSADLLLRFPGQTERIPVLAEAIAKNAKRIDRMTQDLLDAGRIHFGERIVFSVSECELLSLARETITQFAAVHGERFILEGKFVQGYWNAEAFQRALENLLTNAVNYGDPAVPIIVRVDEVYGRAILSVHNEGPSIPIEDQETLFQSFIRAKSANHSKNRGWGLGLAMVRGMAEGHGGSVTVDSAPGRGTTFIIDVPIDSRPYLASPKTPGT
jgi:signal transduction histidine kinase